MADEHPRQARGNDDLDRHYREDIERRKRRQSRVASLSRRTKRWMEQKQGEDKQMYR